MASGEHQHPQSFPGKEASHAEKLKELTPTSGKSKGLKRIQRTFR
jgi:hypothetical protein